MSEKNILAQRSIDFVTTVWQGDYNRVLQADFLEKKITYHCYPFSQTILLVNNVIHPKKVVEQALSLRFFTSIYLLPTFAQQIFSHFSLETKTLSLGKQKHLYPDLSDEWVYYNALAPLGAIFFAEAPYLLYCTGDVFLYEPTCWLEKATLILEKKGVYVANLLWNHRYEEAKKEACGQNRDFFFSEQGFSDQLFCVKTEHFKNPIYSTLCEDKFFPRGEVFEKRVFCHMRKKKWQRATYKKASYHHA